MNFEDPLEIMKPYKHDFIENIMNILIYFCVQHIKHKINFINQA